MDDHEDSEKRERVLLRPWLENLIESGSIPGLEWMDDMKTTFKVPWKHRSKKTWSLRHSSIFLEWAKNTGRWSEGDPEPNYAQLKTRLRCAFNKAPDIEEMKELHRTKSEEPYKVYKFIPRKESKLYPFGRRPLRKTTVPITVRRRRYLVSRICSGNVSGRFTMSDGATIHRVKQEKEEITDMNCAELAADRGFSVTTDSKDWTRSSWFAEKERPEEVGAPWSTIYSREADSQTVNRILPLIVEEENFNSSTSFDLSFPTEDHNDEEPKMQRSTVMSRNSRDSLQDESMINIPKLLKDDPNPALDVNIPSYQTVLPSPSRAAEKREFCRTYDTAHSHQGAAAIYVSSPFVDLPRSESFNSDVGQRILPHADGYLQDQAARYRGGTKQTSAGAASFLVPEQWVNAVTDQNKQQMKKRSFESSIVQEHPVVPFDQSSDNFHREPPPASEHRPCLLPAARLFPLKKHYIMSQNAFCASGKMSPDVVPGQRQNAIVKPNAVAQPQIAVATPYDGKPSLEDESISAAGEVTDNNNGDLLKKYTDSNDVDGQSTETQVMDLSTKLAIDSESKVLDLTKKMVVTPFERNCHVNNSSPDVSKISLLDSGKETGDNLLSSDPAVQSSTVSEILRFKADYKRKKQLIVTKSMILVEKERELKAREKQLAAREEALFWKESYFHKVMSGTDVGTILSAAATRHGAAGLYSSLFDAALPVGLAVSNQMKDVSSGLLLPGAHHLKQSSPVVMSAVDAAGARNRFLSRPEPPGFMPSYQVTSRPIRPPMSSVSSGPPASLFPHYGPISVSMNATRPGQVLDPTLSQKAIGCTVLPPVKWSNGNETSDPRLEPEANVALGDANPIRKRSYCYPTEKTESEVAVSLSSSEDVPSQSLMMVRKRGRPKGSKNKVKLTRFNADSCSALRQMPPLLIIQSPPPPLNDSASGLDPGTPKSLPFNLMRNANIGGITLNAYKSVDASSATGMQVMESSSGQHPTTIAIGSNGYSASRILPPVTSNPAGECSSPRYGVPTLEVPSSTMSMSYSLFDQLSNTEIMPETVRQLLMSASKPVSNILPPLSPPKSPEEFSHAIPPDDVDLSNENASAADENRMMKGNL